MPKEFLDHGPAYFETDFSQWIVEPWNALSSLTFWIPVFYYGWKMRKNPKQFVFLWTCIPLLFIGGLGSTLFHAFRVYPVFLVMDWLPIALLSLSIMVYFWHQILKKTLYTTLVILGLFVVRFGILFLLRQFELPQNVFINVNYAITILSIGIPLTLLLVKTKGKHSIFLVITGVGFALALFFRAIDLDQTWLPMGTHWLWHVCSAVGAMGLAEYLYLFQKNNLLKQN